jgi:hypothetical protein
MKRASLCLLVSLCLMTLISQAQQALPDSPAAQPAASTSALPGYRPPTQAERFRGYIKHSFGISSILEAAVRGGIEQATDEPGQWPQGAQGYADRFGSSMGQIAIRGTTEYLVADLFKEDLRFRGCAEDCDKFTAAFKDTFFARKGHDGHEALSVARLVGPWSGGVVAVNTWYPQGNKDAGQIARQAAFGYGFQFVRNYIREVIAH